MYNLIKSIIAKFLILILLLTSSTPAYARIILETEYLFENSGNAWILDSLDDVTGDLTLQFGNSLGETITFDTTNSEFDISNNLNLGQNQLIDVVIDNLSTAPGSPVIGQLYYNTVDDKMYMWNSSAWEDVIHEPHAASHTDGTDDIQDATDSQKGLMTAQHVQDLGDVLTQSDEINRNTINVQLDLDEYVTSSVAYLTYDNPDDTTFVANIENVEYTINDNPATGIALTGGSDASPVLNYIYVRESGGNGIVEASTNDPEGQAFDYVPIGEVLLGTVGVSSATYYYVENLTNYIRNFIGDTNYRLRITGVIYVSGINLANTGLEIATTQGTVIHMHEEITYTAKDTTTDNMIDAYYNVFGQLDNTNYDDGSGGNDPIGANKFHKLFIWGDIYGGLHMERQQKPSTNEYTSATSAEDDTDDVAVNSVPGAFSTVGFPIAHLILQQGTADVEKLIDLRTTGGGAGGASAQQHTQNTDAGTINNIWILDLDDTNSGSSIKFGNTLAETLTWDATNSEFDLSDDLNLAQAQLRGAAMDNLAAAPGSPVAGQIYHNTSDNKTYVYNGSAWEDITITDFEGLYADDADDTLTTSNAAFTINTGTSDFIVTSNDWSVDASGNLAANNVTANGTLDANGVVTIGDGGDTVTIDSSVWDISGAGAASGLTGIISTGTIDFRSSDSFSVRNNADPANNAACSYVGELIYDTTDKILQHCTATGGAGVATWEDVDTTGSTPDLEAVYTTDGDNTLTTSNGIFTINTGTNDFIVTSNDWGVDSSGNITTSGTVDGIDVAGIGAQAHDQNTDTGTTANTFTLDTDDTGGNVIMQFGTGLAETIFWDSATTRFTLTDDVRTEGNLAVVGQAYVAANHSASDSDGYLNLGRNSSAWENLAWVDANSQFELSDNLSLGQAQIKDVAIDNLASAPGSPVTGQIYHNTTDNNTYIYNGSTWEDITLGAAGAQDFEGVYAADADNTLTTGNGTFTINTGTNDFIVTSNDWGVDASGNLTVNGTLDANGIVTIGDGGDTVTIDSSSWDISSAGLMTGVTGITSTGNINFVNASTFRIPQAISDPGTCAEGQEYYNTVSNEIRLCTSTDTWSSTTASTGRDYVYAYDTTTQGITNANTYQDVTFNTNGLINGWTHTPGTANFTAGISGLYLVTVDIVASKTGAGADDFEIRALFNGAEVAGSQMGTGMSVKNINFDITSSFLLSATASQILKIQVASSTATTSIAPGGATATTRPSAKITIVRLN